MCKDLNCYNTENGKDYKNGESWCVYDSEVGDGKDLVGSRHYRHVCIMGEETVEPCGDYRTEQCIQANIESVGVTFTEAACRANRWTDCVDQKEKEDCLNTDKRDCYWFDGAMFTGLTKQTQTSSAVTTGKTFTGGTTGGFSGGTATTGSAIAPITGYATSNADVAKEAKTTASGVQLGGGACLPYISPGLKFWSDGDASSICSLGNSVCAVTYEKGLVGAPKKCVDNCDCLDQSYAQTMNRVCTSLGDCGAYTNIANKFTNDGAEWKVDGDKQTITQGMLGSLAPNANTQNELASQNPLTDLFNKLGGLI